jgi:hypothetical protein
VEASRKRELAFLYLHNELGNEEKQIVFGLILHDETFRRLLKEELELRERMKCVRTRLEPDNKSKLLAAVKLRALEEAETVQPAASGEPAWLRWSEWTLRLALPPLVYPIMKILQRRLIV